MEFCAPLDGEFELLPEFLVLVAELDVAVVSEEMGVVVCRAAGDGLT